MERVPYELDAIIEKEKVRLLREKETKEKELSDYPRGSLLKREMNGRIYCYYRYRDGAKIVTKYAGTEKVVKEVEAIIKKRNAIIDRLKVINRELAHIEKIEAMK